VVESHFVTGDRIGEAELRRCFDTGMFLVAARAGEPPAACLFLRPNGERRTYLGMLAVDPALQRRGLGSLMMAAAERRCRIRGDAAIDISVVDLRTELPPFYRARGFVEAGTAPFEDPRAFKAAHFVKMALML
jgi:GNAT superfamily N-acetyltransferase